MALALETALCAPEQLEYSDVSPLEHSVVSQTLAAHSCSCFSRPNSAVSSKRSSAAARRTRPSSEVSLVRSSLVSLNVATREIVKTIGANGANVANDANGDAAQPLGLDCIEDMADTADMVGMVDMAGTVVVVVEPMCLYISLCR